MATLASLADGALVKFGSIYEKPIIWRVIGQNHYGDGQTSLVTDRLIKYMCVDAKESSNSDSDREYFGNNRYIYSNMHQWLNSDAVSWYTAQHSADAPPSNANVWDNYNEYDTFPGFLNGFTADEKNAIRNTSLTCERASVDGGGVDSFTAKVFLLSCTEIGLSGGQVCGTQFPMFNSDSARLAYGTAEAVANSEYKDINTSTTSSGYWWLRDAYASDSRSVNGVDASGSLDRDRAFRGYRGARPALNLSSSISLSSSTDADGCYTLVLLLNTVTFNSNGGIFSSDSTTSKSVQTNLDGTVSLSSIVEFPVKSGYAFKGWSTTENGSVVYTPYATPTITEDTTLYAVWEKVELYLVHKDTLVNIANAVRKKTGGTDAIALGDMATMIAALGPTISASSDTLTITN